MAEYILEEQDKKDKIKLDKLADKENIEDIEKEKDRTLLERNNSWITWLVEKAKDTKSAFIPSPDKIKEDKQVQCN